MCHRCALLLLRADAPRVHTTHTQVPDVRDVVKSYDGQDIPAAFRERMKRVQEQTASRQQQGKGFLGGLTKRGPQVDGEQR